MKQRLALQLQPKITPSKPMIKIRVLQERQQSVQIRLVMRLLREMGQAQVFQLILAL